MIGDDIKKNNDDKKVKTRKNETSVEIKKIFLRYFYEKILQQPSYLQQPSAVKGQIELWCLRNLQEGQTDVQTSVWRRRTILQSRFQPVC